MIDLLRIAVERPTGHPPGTEAKLQRLEQRYALGLPLWVEGDSTQLIETESKASGRASEETYREPAFFQRERIWSCF